MGYVRLLLYCKNPQLGDRSAEIIMPHVIVKLYPVKSEADKNKLALEITKAVTNTLYYGDESVSVAFEEVAAKHWMERSTSLISAQSRIV